METQLFDLEESEPPGSMRLSDASQIKSIYQVNSSLDQFNDQKLLSVKHPSNVELYSSKTLKLNIINSKTEKFIGKHFPNIDINTWNDWKWQIKNSIRSYEQLKKYILLSEKEHNAFLNFNEQRPLLITPYYLSLIAPDNPMQPLRRSVIPVEDEYILSEGEENDPLGEDTDSPVPDLVHRYPNRVLFLVTKNCSTLCRYCTRSRIILNNHVCQSSMEDWKRAISYIESNENINDVLISGGDPLLLNIQKLEWLLMNLRKIKHVEIIRIGTKIPVVLPQKITRELCRMLKKYHPLFMSIHFTHYEELTEETYEVCSKLANAGIPLGSQTVLLKDINDNVETMRKLMQGLLKFRVRPYYIYQCDPVTGSSHFRTPVSKGIEIIKGLRGHISGYAVPNYVIDAPQGGGKIPLLPNYCVDKQNDNIILQNYKGLKYKYPDYIKE